MSQTPPEALAELSRTQLLLQLATLPDLAFESDGFDALSPALQHVTDVIRQALAVDTAGIALRQPGQAALVPAAQVGTSGAAATDAEPLLARVFAGGAPVRLGGEASVAAGAAAGASDGSANGEVQDLLCRLSARALMAVPIGVDGEPPGGAVRGARRRAAL